MAFGRYVPVPDSLGWLQSKSFLWTEQSNGFRISGGVFCLFLCLFLRGGEGYVILSLALKRLTRGLRSIGLFTLEKRWLRVVMIQAYEITNDR